MPLKDRLVSMTKCWSAENVLVCGSEDMFFQKLCSNVGAAGKITGVDGKMLERGKCAGVRNRRHAAALVARKEQFI